MPEISKLVARLVGETGDFKMDMKEAAGAAKEFKAAAGSASKDTKDFSGSLGGLRSAAGNLLESGLLIKAGYELLQFGKDSIVAAEEAAQAQAQLEAVIRSTGGAAGVTADEVQDMAMEMMHLTGVEDDLIVRNAAVLLTFTKIGKDIFPDATAAALDMSAALGQSLQSSIVQIGKALNDPIEGVTALRRVGVSFTNDQQKVIKSLVDSGKLLDAQKFILQELQTEFGGTAQAMHDAGSGSDTLRNSVGNLQEAFGTGLIPVVRDANELLSGWIDRLTFAIEVENALKEAEEDGIITKREMADMINRMTWTSYSAADAMIWLNQKTTDFDVAAKKFELEDMISTLGDAESAAGGLAEKLELIPVALKEVTDAQLAAAAVDAVTDAFKEGLISQGEYDAMMRDIGDSLTDLTDEEINQQIVLANLGRAYDEGRVPLEDYIDTITYLAQAWRLVPKEVTTTYHINAPYGAEPGPPVPVYIPPGAEGEYGGRKAGGGAFEAGDWFWAGEHGPEPVVAAFPGRVLSHGDAMKAVEGGEAITINLGGVHVGENVDYALAYKVGMAAGEGVRAAMRARGLS